MSWTLGELYQAMGIAALMWAVLSGAALWWLSKNFAGRAALEELKARQERMDARLGAGDTRFAAMDAAIREATKAAEAAEAAADKASLAAEKIGDARVELAELRGDIKTLNAVLARLERDNGHLVHGHMKLGANA